MFANGHKPVDPERLVALEREAVIKSAELLRRQEGLTYRSVFGKRKGTSYIVTGKCR